MFVNKIFFRPVCDAIYVLNAINENKGSPITQFNLGLSFLTLTIRAGIHVLILDFNLVLVDMYVCNSVFHSLTYVPYISSSPGAKCHPQLH